MAERIAGKHRYCDRFGDDYVKAVTRWSNLRQVRLQKEKSCHKISYLKTGLAAKREKLSQDEGT
jgi:hypothetical protein